MTLSLDVSKLSQAGARKVTPHDNCVVLDVSSGSFPRYIEVRLPDDDGARQTALWDGSLNLQVNDEVLCHEYSNIPVWRVMSMGGNDSGAGKHRVSEIWRSGFDAVAAEADATGAIFINETTNAGMTVGLTINQGTNSDEILALKQDNVAHGMTTPTETDTFGLFSLSDADVGGLLVGGYRDADGVASRAIILSGNLGEAASTIKTTAGQGVINLTSRVKSGTDVAAVGADGNLLSIRNFTTTRLIVDAEGTIHQIPSSDADIDLLTVQVTGAPTLSWDESEDTFDFSKGLDILNASGAQLRLTHTDASKFVDFILDTNHDLTITPSSTGQVIFQPTTDSTDFFQVLDDAAAVTFNVDTSNLGVGVLTEDNSFVLQGTTVRGNLFVERGAAAGRRTAVFSAVGASQPDNTFLRARAGPGAVADGDPVANFFFNGHDGTDYNRSVRIFVDVEGAVSANTVPMSLTFQTSATNSGGLADRLKIFPDGDIIVGSGTPSAQLHIIQSDASSDEPVLLLKQDDVDEPFTKYIGTAAAATLTRSIVAEADVTTATRQGFVKIEVQDDGNQVTDQDYFVAFYTLV